MDRMSKLSGQAAFQSFPNTTDLKSVFDKIKDGHEHSIVVVPSLSLKDDSIKNIVGIIHYESRALWEVLNATTNKTQIVFISSLPIEKEAINHFLNMTENAEQAKRRVKLISLNDDCLDETLSEKLYKDEETLMVIKELVKGKPAYLKVFMTTPAEHQLAQTLNLPLFGHDSSLNYYLTKSGNKKVFRESNVPYCDSVEDLTSVNEIKQAVIALWEKHPMAKRFMVKLDNGVSGIGNAILTPSMSYREFCNKTQTQKYELLDSWFISMKFQSEKITWGLYSKDIPRGCIVEVFAEGETKVSPSAQAQILPNGEVEILSTHEQVLDETGLTFLGSIFPAQNTHRHILQENTLRIGQTLASLGFVGPFSVDFMIASDEMTTRVYVIEINIRQGGTTHPYQTTRLLTKAKYCPNKAVLMDMHNRPVYYRSNDNVVEKALCGTKVDKFLDYMESKKITFNKDKEEGVVFHLLGAMPTVGKLGYTSIAKNPAKAQENSDKVLNLINQFIIENQKELPAFHQNLA